MHGGRIQIMLIHASWHRVITSPIEDPIHVYTTVRGGAPWQTLAVARWHWARDWGHSLKHYLVPRITLSDTLIL